MGGAPRCCAGSSSATFRARREMARKAATNLVAALADDMPTDRVC